MDYVCKVGTPTGEVLEQTFSAPDESALRTDLEQKGYYLFSVRRGLGLRDLGLRRPHVATEKLLLFAQELAALLKAGLPLVQSLDVMLERQKDPVFRRSLETVREKVKSGIALSDAFKAEGALYPPILSASLIAGERSGNLEGVLRRLVQYLRLTYGLRRKAIAAAVYPLLLFGMMGALLAVMMLWVIPGFKDFYGGMDLELPLLTRVVMAFALFFRHNVVWVLLALAGVFVAFRTWSRREGSAILVDRFLLSIPYLGHLMRMYSTSQLARTLAALLQGGLPLLNALEVAGASIGNRAMAAAVSGASLQIREGRSLTAALESTDMVDTLTLEMVKVGEQTGALGDMLNAVADFYDEEMETSMAKVLSLVEPILLVFMAFIVAAMLLAFYLPMFEAISGIERRGV
ncbi:MAG TPA: type II secretion system F family protein [Vicinamibacteria bacterium]|nr:type II secretion system F family protein [Vicinamibacteria bacterium]